MWEIVKVDTDKAHSYTHTGNVGHLVLFVISQCS